MRETIFANHSGKTYSHCLTDVTVQALSYADFRSSMAIIFPAELPPEASPPIPLQSPCVFENPSELGGERSYGSFLTLLPVRLYFFSPMEGG